MQGFLTEHAWGNARWSDLVRSLQQASNTDLTEWSRRWILSPGMPTVRARWRADASGAIVEFAITQEATVGSGTWPLHVELLLLANDGTHRRMVVNADHPETVVEELIGKPAPAGVLVNPGDVAYGRFLPDSRTRDVLLERFSILTEPLERAVALTALFDAVRETELSPHAFAELAESLVLEERDPPTHGWLLDSLLTTILRYLEPAAATRAAAELGARLLSQLRAGLDPDRALQVFRMLVRLSEAPAVLDLCADLLKGDPPRVFGKLCG